MRRVLWLVLTLGLISSLFSLNPPLAADQVASVKQALSQALCYGVYWMGSNYDLGRSLPIQIRMDGPEVFVWIPDLEVTKSDHMAGFFVGRLKEGKGVVTHAESYNINLTPPLPAYLKNRRYFETGTVIKETLTMPEDCTPNYDPSSPQKELMVRTVVSTMQKTLGRWAKTSIKKYPAEVNIIIADFNIDYPSTYVLVKPGDELYSVTLHDPQDYDSDEYEREGIYPLGERRVEPGMENLLAKIRKHGITRKIVLMP